MSKVLTLSIEYDHDYSLIGINGTLEDYRLAYFLNKNLDINLKRQTTDLCFSSIDYFFNWFHFDCQLTYSSWSLISNKHTFTSQTEEKINLFTEESKVSYLINEKKEVDYFFKITGDLDSDEIKKIIKKIRAIKGISTSYAINPTTLKSKDFLIF